MLVKHSLFRAEDIIINGGLVDMIYKLYCRNRGFTLIEILTVVVLLVIAALMVVPSLSSAGSVQVMAAADIVAADLQYARSMAIAHAQNYFVKFNTNTNCYELQDKDGNVITHPVKKGDYKVDFANDSRLSSVNISSASFDSTLKLRFDYLGSPFNGCGNPLNSGSVTVSCGSISKTISVEPVTGIVSIQ